MQRARMIVVLPYFSGQRWADSPPPGLGPCCTDAQKRFQTDYSLDRQGEGGCKSAWVENHRGCFNHNGNEHLQPSPNLVVAHWLTLWSIEEGPGGEFAAPGPVQRKCWAGLWIVQLYR